MSPKQLFLTKRETGDFPLVPCGGASATSVRTTSSESYAASAWTSARRSRIPGGVTSGASSEPASRYIANLIIDSQNLLKN